MIVLLDTHAFLWFCQNDPSLSEAAKALLEDPANQKLVSIASCWEIAIKVGLNKLTLGEPSRTYLANALARTMFGLLPITLEHATAVEALPLHQRDPFDRLLIAQAMSESIAIISADLIFDRYPVSRPW